MTGLRNDLRATGCGLAALAAAVICLVTTAAATDDLNSKVDPTKADPVIAAIDVFIAEQALDKSAENWKSEVPPPPIVIQFDPAKTYYWNLETNRGDLKIKLFPESAPLHVVSTIYLTRLGFYDDLKFHRIVTDFVVQGGDPTGTGNGGPGYRFGGEFESGLLHNKKGIVSTANAGPDTDGSQFFITLGPAASLNGKHTIFGELDEGKATLSKLGKTGTTRGKPQRKVFIKKATITIE